MKERHLCVFCGSRHGQNPRYTEEAKALGRLFVEQGITLVYGGGSIGLMGEIADQVLSLGGQVRGVIPSMLQEKEVGHDGLTEMFVVDGMHPRKAKMAELSDAFIAMPGGLGTFEELCEMLTWSQLGIHQKPIALLDVEGFFQPFLAMIEHGVREGFIQPEHRELFMIESDPQKLVSRLLSQLG